MKKHVVTAVLPLALVVLAGAVQSQRADIARWQQMTDAEFLRDTYLLDTEGVANPELLSSGSLKYPPEAYDLKIEGKVTIQAVVMPDGTVARARVVKSLDERYGLDEEAVRNVLAWTFKPNTGRFKGQPVPVTVPVIVEFRIHRG